jgi:two-component system cell cycle response regulator
MFTNNKISAPILVIEPSRVFQEIIEQLISAQQLSAIYCASAEEAMKLSEQQNFSLVLVANALPDMTGIELAKNLRKHISPSSVILLLITASQKELIKQALKSGITEVIERHLLNDINIYLDHLAKEKQQTENETITILSVEDSIPMGQLTEQFLTEAGFNVITVRSAEESLVYIDKQPIDILISDILLHGKMSGIGLIRQVRQKAAPIAHLPILAVSGLDNSDQRIEALKQGANDFINKPVNLTELVVRVRNLVKSDRLYKQLIAKEAQLKAMAVTDPLTQLYNRHYLSEVGLKLFSEAQRHRQSLAMLVVDIDHFKEVNDNHGHLVGDAVLQQVATVLKSHCRQEDFAVRFGGEEFVIILPYSSPKDGAIKAESLRLEIEQLKPENLTITVSIGVSGFTEDNPHQYDFAQVFQRADDAVFKAKASGRNQVCLIE